MFVYLCLKGAKGIAGMQRRGSESGGRKGVFSKYSKEDIQDLPVAESPLQRSSFKVHSCQKYN